jgi:hypothetical protein
VRRLRAFLTNPEIIGPSECPLIYRWTLVNTRFGKLLVHRFLPHADDRAEHDHPSSFLTIVLRGHYVDENPNGRDFVRAPTIRWRPATHRHRTRVGPRGCLTIVVMGPKRRRWGFWKDGQWYFWKDHERIFGFGMRCSDDD